MRLKLKKESIFAVIAITLIAWYSSQQFNIKPIQDRILATSVSTSTRIGLVDQTCSGISRSTLNSTTTRSSYINSVNASIGIDGLGFIRLALGSKTQQAADLVKNNPQGYLIFVLSFFIGLFIFLVVSPFLMCCCLCPNCCPNCCCCRKTDQSDFTNCQIKYPIIFALICLIGASICSIYFLATNYKNTDSIQKTMCAASIAYDDILNGNQSVSGKYFVGINTLPSLLAQLSGNITNLDSNLSELYSNSSSTNLNQAIIQSKTTQTDIKKIPNNDGTSGSALTLNYPIPLDTTSTTSTISSTFPSVLGSYAGQNGLVWGIYQAVYTFQQILSGLKTNATTIHDNVASIQSSLTTASNQANTFLGSIKYQSNATFVTSVSRGSDAGSGLKIGSLVYSIVIIVLAIVTSIVVICLRDRKSNSLRCFLYLLCFIFFLLTIFGFLITVILSVTLPAHAWSCNFIQDSLTSQTNLQTNFISITQQSNLKYIGKCMPFGDGDIIAELGGNQISTYISTINAIMSTVSSFNSTTYLSPIKVSMNSALTVISQYGLSKIGDITDSTSISKIKSLQTCSGQTNCNSACSNDSWVPSNSLVSNSQNYTCQVSSGSQGTATTCGSGVSSTSGGCKGCMDSAQVLFYYINSSSLPTDLSLRYGSICSFNTKLNNVWNNYYKIKQIALGPTVGSTTSSSGVYHRGQTVSTDLTTLTTKVDALNTTFKNILSGLNSIYHLVDPAYGLTASLNCKVLGQDTQNFQNQACGELYDYMYIMRIVIGIMSYLLAVSTCCMVCIGSRNYRRIQNLDQTYRPKNNDQIQMQNGFQSGQKLGPNRQIQPIYFGNELKFM